MVREKMFRWIVRGMFWCGFAYAYFAIWRQHLFAPYKFLLENLFLAYVPIELSLRLGETTRWFIFWPIFVVWLFFYPNAPYMLTDLFHLALRNPYILRADGTRTGLLMPDMSIWLTFLDMAACTLAGTLVGILTLHRTASVLLLRFGRKTVCWQTMLVLAISIVASVGIYIGRFPRLHTVHLVTRPLETVRCLMAIWDMRLVAFTVILTLMQMFIWFLLMLIRLPPEGRLGTLASSRLSAQTAFLKAEKGTRP